MGFPVPLGAWLRGRHATVVDEYVLGARAQSRGLFDKGFVKELVTRHRAGENHTERLWMLINFELWQRMFIDREGSLSISEGLAALGAGGRGRVEGRIKKGILEGQIRQPV